LRLQCIFRGVSLPKDGFVMTELGPRLSRLPSDTLATLSFFTRLPVRAPAGSFDLHQSAAAWPIAGLVLAVVPAVLYWLALAAGMPAMVGALIALAVLAALTGAMHEDGLADTADGFGGGTTREEKLAVMRDSGLGTYGALALLFSVVGRAAALAALIYAGIAAGALAILMVAVISRSMALWHWNSTLPARSEGLAWAAGRPDWMALAIGLVLGGLAAVVLLIVFGLGLVIGVLLAALATSIFTGLCVRQIGGHTGDTIGAAQQIAETLLLVGLTAGWTPLLD
jgi:adenosylcobinamide-GDP ribazoletransferase